MKKKGMMHFNMILSVALVFIFLYALMLTVSKINGVKEGSNQDFKREIGMAQKAMLRTYYRGEEQLFALDQSASLALQQSIYDFGQNGGFGEGSPCGEYHGYQLLSGIPAGIERDFEGQVPQEELEFEKCSPNIQEDIKNTFITNVEPYFALLAQPQTTHTYTVSKENGIQIIGIPNAPFSYEIRSTIQRPKQTASNVAEPQTPSYDYGGTTSKQKSRKTAELMRIYGSSEEEVRTQLVSLQFPAGGGKTREIQVHKKAKCAFEKVINALQQCPQAQTYIIRSVGTFSWRSVRSGTAQSLHSFGIAIDFNEDTNPMCPTPTRAGYDPKKLCKTYNDLVTDIPPCMVRVFTDNGFSWGGLWPTPKDAMHFEYRGEACCGQVYC